MGDVGGERQDRPRCVSRPSTVATWMHFSSTATDDIDYRAAEGALDDHGPIQGKDALRAFMQDWLDMFDDFRAEPVELIEAGEDKVIAVVRISGRAKLSGVETDLTYAELSRSETGRSRGAANTGHETRPSKPPGCRSRRCRRRTSRSSAGYLRVARRVACVRSL